MENSRRSISLISSRTPDCPRRNSARSLTDTEVRVSGATMRESGACARRSVDGMTDPDDRWRVWDQRPEYGDLLRRRATGELPEMESAVAAADQVAKLLRSGGHILDVGAGAGHYLR